MTRAALRLAGVVADLPAYQAPPDAWTTARNVVMRPYAERVQGYSSVYGALSTNLRSIMNARLSSGVNFWLYNGPTSMYATDGTTTTDLSPGGLTSVTALNRWSVGMFNGVPYANNAADAPMYWDGNTANNFAALPGWIAGSSCGALRSWSNFLIAMNMSEPGGEYPDRVRWSSAAPVGTVPGTWTAAATNEAGDFSCSSTPGALIDGAPLGGNFVLYKNRSAFLMQYIKGTLIFSVTPLPIARGVLALNCIANFKGRHFLLTEGDMVVTDGVSVESVAADVIRKWFFNQLDQTTYDACFVIENRRESEIIVCLPTAGGTKCDLAAVWNWQRNKWGIRELPSISCGALGIVSDTAPTEVWSAMSGTWDSYSRRWGEQPFSEAVESVVVGAPNDTTPSSSLAHKLDSGDTANGAAIAATLGKYSMDFGDPNLVKTVRRVYPFADSPVLGTTLTVRVGSQMTPTGAVQWSASQPFVIGTDQFVNTFAVGRYISVEFSSSSGARWSLPSFEVLYNERGRY